VNNTGVNCTRFLALNNSVLAQDVRLDEPYRIVEQYVDVVAFIDYCVVNWGIGNIDWGNHNFYFGFNEARGNGLLYQPWDNDGSFEYANFGYPAYTGSWGYVDGQYFSTNFNSDADLPRYSSNIGREILGQLIWRLCMGSMFHVKD